MGDEKERFLGLLKTVEDAPPDTPVGIGVDVDKGIGSNHFFSAREIKNILMSAIFETPALRNERNAALAYIEALQGQIVGVTLEFEPPKWEYKTYRYSENLNYQSVFNQLGGEGWELVSVEKPHAFFKRPKQGTEND